MLYALILTEKNTYVRDLMYESVECLRYYVDSGGLTTDSPYALIRAFDLAEEAFKPLPPDQQSVWGKAWVNAIFPRA